MTLSEQWLDKGCSAENIERKLKTLLKNQRWTDYFCRDEQDCYVVYCQTNAQMRKEAETYDIPYVSSVYNEELALEIIRDCIKENAKQIADWFGQPEKTKSFLYVGNEPVGIVKLQKDLEFTPTFTALITLKKCGHSNRNCSGFFVSDLCPIPEIPI